jgi:protein O-GlcNAc transferase
VVDLPCIVTFDPPDDYGVSGVSRPPVQANGYITFGCYSRYEKLSTAYLATVQEILLAVPDSRLLLKDDSFRRPYSIRRVLSIMDAVDPKRILFGIGTSQPDHFLAYQQSDLILDPFPHSGGTCCLEQLWMGVPIVTLYGSQAAGRTTSSVLKAMGRGIWVTGSREGYITVAVALASHPEELAKPRKTLRQELLDSPICKGYVTAVERVYEKIIKEKATVSA